VARFLWVPEDFGRAPRLLREVVLPSLVDAGLAASLLDGGVGGAESYAYHEPYITRARRGYQPQTLRILERGANCS
jgi:hypothetical protein